MKLLGSVAIAFALTALACGGSSSSTAPTTTPSSNAPTLQISGSVTTYRFVPTASGDFGNIEYVVTTNSNRAVSGCFVEVKWLDEEGVQVGFTFAGVDVAIPAGMSTLTDQDFVRTTEAERIKDSRVEYSLCS